MRNIITIALVCIVAFATYNYLKKDVLVVRPLTIIAFGDSLTAGYGVSENDSYPSLLETALKEKGIQNVDIINAGFSGDTTRDALLKVNNVISKDPDVVLLGFGANDMLRKHPPAETKKNIEALVTALQENDIEVVLLGMKANILMGSTYKNEFDTVYTDIARVYDIPLVPYMLEDVALKPDLNNEDRIHPNKQGYEIVVRENILPVVLPFLRKTFE